MNYFDLQHGSGGRVAPHMPIDPDEAPWTDEYAELEETRAEIYRQRMIEQAEEIAWEQHHLLLPS